MSIKILNAFVVKQQTIEAKLNNFWQLTIPAALEASVQFVKNFKMHKDQNNVQNNILVL